MTTEQFANFSQSSLAKALGTNDTIIWVADATTFPSSGNFRIVVQAFDASGLNPISKPEIMIVTGVSGNAFTVQRGQESTKALGFHSGAKVTHVVTAAVMTALEAGGGGGGGIASINGDTTSAQIIAGGTGISVASASGTTTITATNSGSVTSVSIVSANGFSGSVANPTTTPAITIDGSKIVTNLDFGGRLTASSGVPVTTTDQTSVGTIYYTQYNHGYIKLYDGSTWKQIAFTNNTSLALTATSGKNYDVFGYLSSGDLALELSAAWTDDTTRADTIAKQDGIDIKSSDHTRVLLGTIRASGSNITEDSGGGISSQVGGKRFIWNRYNQVIRFASVIDTTDSWLYVNNIIRQANGASGNKIEYITGDIATLVQANVYGDVYLYANNNYAAKVGIGIDNTTTFSGFVQGGYNTNTFVMGVSQGLYAPVSGAYKGYPGLGYHYISWNEKGADNNCVFLGDNGGDGQQCGLTVEILN